MEIKIFSILLFLTLFACGHSFCTFCQLKPTLHLQANRRRMESDGHSKKLDDIIKDRYDAFKDAEPPAPSKRRHRVSVSKHAFPVLELLAACENTTFAAEVESLVTALEPVKNDNVVHDFIKNLNKTLQD